MKSTSVRWVTRNQAQNQDKLQSRIKTKPYFCNYSWLLFNPPNYLKCDSRILDFSELRSITLSFVSFSKVKSALRAFQTTSCISKTVGKGKNPPDLNHPFSMKFPGAWGRFHMLCSCQMSVCSRLHTLVCWVQLRATLCATGQPGLLSWPSPRSASPLTKGVVNWAGEVWPQFSLVSSF